MSRQRGHGSTGSYGSRNTGSKWKHFRLFADNDSIHSHLLRLVERSHDGSSRSRCQRLHLTRRFNHSFLSSLLVFIRLIISNLVSKTMHVFLLCFLCLITGFLHLVHVDFVDVFLTLLLSTMALMALPQCWQTKIPLS